MPSGQYIPGMSLLHQMDSRVKLLGFLSMIAAVVTAKGFLGYGFVILAISALILLSRLPIQTLVQPIRRLWLFMITIFLMNGLFFGGETPLFNWWIIHISMEGIKQGTHVVLNLMLIMVLANVLTSTTAPMDLTFGLMSLLAPLKLIRVPVAEVAMIVGAAIQFIPVLIQEADLIKKAQTARGARFESKHFLEKAASFQTLIIPLFLSAFRRADELAMAMEARGYISAQGRTAKAPQPMRFKDMAALLCSALICAVQMILIGGI